MSITTANYFASVQSVDWNGVPASLKKTHETLIPDVSKDDWKAYNTDEDIKRTVNKFFGYMGKYIPNAAPTQPAVTTPSPSPPASPKPPKKTRVARAKPANKKPIVPELPPDLPEPKQVTIIPTATAFIKRYAALHGKVKTRDQILSLTHGFQKAITEQRIKKDNPCFQELERMQRELLTLLSSMTGSVRIEIDAAFLAHCKQIAEGEEVRTSVKLIKSFISMSGKAYDKVKAGALLKKMEAAVGKIPAEDPYRSQLIKALETLTGYCKGNDKTIGVPPAFLYGLGSVAVGGGMDGLGIVVTGSGGGAIIRLLRAAEIKDLSDRTLKKALRHTAAPGLCFEIAKGLIQRRELTMEVLNAPPSKKKNYWETGIGLTGPESSMQPSGLRGINKLDILETQLARTATVQGIGRTGLGSLDVGVPPTERFLERSEQPSSLAAPKSTDVVSARELANMTFKTIGYKGQFRDVVGDPATGFHMMVYGKPWQGKSSFVIELCKELAGLKKGKVAYVCLEEGISASMQKKVHDRKADNVDDLKFTGSMPTSFEGYGFVVLDSVNDRGMKRDRLRQLFLQNPETCFICIFHATKSGDARGGLDYSHDMDIIIRIDAHQPYVEKNRFL